MKKKTNVIAFYLPQFHPIPENDIWWGKGFTEWTNVGKAKKLFKQHEQPKVPADLGYYDLRLSEPREEQAILAKEFGIDAFCYWHYWFGNGRRLLEKPFEEVLKLKSPNFPFCLAWANHSWEYKSWVTNYDISKESKLLIEQVYPGIEDYDLHFYTMLEAFRDERYYKIDEKLVFMIYNPLGFSDCNFFIDRWQELAIKNNLPQFFFIAHSYVPSQLNQLKALKFNAINLSLHHMPFNNNMAFKDKLKRYIRSNYLKRPEIVKYVDAISKMIDPVFREKNIYPTIIPNWDHTPRSGFSGRVFQNCTPELFGNHIDDVLDLIKDKDENNKVIFIKSWNEWAEGNYLEPDLKYGKGHLEMLKKKLY